jgi:hypothetical protein
MSARSSASSGAGQRLSLAVSVGDSRYKSCSDKGAHDIP